MSEKLDKTEFRLTARVDAKTKKRFEKVSEQTGLSSSDLLRIGLLKLLPEFESGRIDIGTLKKAA